MKITIYYLFVFAVIAILYLCLQDVWKKKRVPLAIICGIALLIVLLLFL